MKVTKEGSLRNTWKWDKLFFFLTSNTCANSLSRTWKVTWRDRIKWQLNVCFDSLTPFILSVHTVKLSVSFYPNWNCIFMIFVLWKPHKGMTGSYPILYYYTNWKQYMFFFLKPIIRVEYKATFLKCAVKL